MTVYTSDCSNSSMTARRRICKLNDPGSATANERYASPSAMDRWRIVGEPPLRSLHPDVESVVCTTSGSCDTEAWRAWHIHPAHLQPKERPARTPGIVVLKSSTWSLNSLRNGGIFVG